MIKTRVIIDIPGLKAWIEDLFPSFGPNKRQELSRLVYEIAKREQIDYRKVLKSEFPPRRYHEIKMELLARRFPSIPAHQRRVLRDAFPELDVLESARQEIHPQLSLQPKHFFVERSVRESPLVARLRQNFLKSQFTEISSYKDFIGQKPFTLAEYNRRFERVFIVREQFDFLLACPCTPGAVSCGYQIMNLGVGCAFECVYCYLQAYSNAPGILIPANIQDYLDRLADLPAGTRIGTGQFTDSLIFDPWTGFAAQIVQAMRGYPKLTFEFKTKSNHVDGLLSVPAARNVVAAWSVNPQRIIDQVEFYTAPLSERLEAARRCAQAGYGVAFHFDPIIFYSGWEADYGKMVEQIFAIVPQKSVRWISLGTLRMTLKQKRVIENRFPSAALLDAELVPGFDGKLRYASSLRSQIYSALRAKIHQSSGQTPVYLCMEEREASAECPVCVAGEEAHIEQAGRLA